MGNQQSSNQQTTHEQHEQRNEVVAPLESASSGTEFDVTKCSDEDFAWKVKILGASVCKQEFQRYRAFPLANDNRALFAKCVLRNICGSSEEDSSSDNNNDNKALCESQTLAKLQTFERTQILHNDPQQQQDRNPLEEHLQEVYIEAALTDELDLVGELEAQGRSKESDQLMAQIVHSMCKPIPVWTEQQQQQHPHQQWEMLEKLGRPSPYGFLSNWSPTATTKLQHSQYVQCINVLQQGYLARASCGLTKERREEKLQQQQQTKRPDELLEECLRKERHKRQTQQ